MSDLTLNGKGRNITWDLGYMMGCVPMFIVFAAIDHQMVRRAILILNAALCMLYMILFLQGQAIM